MSAKWLFGSVEVFATDEDINREVKRAELFILDATESTYHYFGSGSEKRSIKGMVIGDTNRNSLITLATGDTAFTLTTPWGTVSNAKINGSPKFSAVKYSGGVIDGVAYSASTTPLYNCELEVITN